MQSIPAAHIVIATTLIIFLLFTFVPAQQARKRGYSFLVWYVTGVLALNPIYLLIVLAAIPDRAKQRLRNQYRRELNAKLATRARQSSAALPVCLTDAPQQSIGDQPTMAPPATLPSVGDQPTQLPGA